jgi:hypothetical protein
MISEPAAKTETCVTLLTTAGNRSSCAGQNGDRDAAACFCTRPDRVRTQRWRTKENEPARWPTPSAHSKKDKATTPLTSARRGQVGRLWWARKLGERKNMTAADSSAENQTTGNLTEDLSGVSRNDAKAESFAKTWPRQAGTGRRARENQIGNGRLERWKPGTEETNHKNWPVDLRNCRSGRQQ